MLYILIITIVNLGLGYGIAVYLKRRGIDILAWVERSTLTNETASSEIAGIAPERESLSAAPTEPAAHSAA